MKKIRSTKPLGKGASKEGTDNGLEAEKARLREKDPAEWTVSDVGKWLDCIDMAQYKIVFIENSVSGSELFELENEDLASINIRMLGHRKKILKRIEQLKKNSAVAFQALSDDSSGTSSDDSGGGGTGSKQSRSESEKTTDSKGKRSRSSAAGTGEEVTFKCFYDDDVTVIRTKGRISLNRLKRKLNAEYKSDLDIKFKDEDGDLMPISRLPHLKAAVKEAGGKPVRLFLADPQKTVGLSAADTLVLENLVDSCIIINKRGNVVFFNEAAEELFGYRKKQVVGRNVKILMPANTAEQHDLYIKNYLARGEGVVIGSGRVVIAKKKDKATFPIHLSVSETRLMDGELVFIGLLRELPKSEATKASGGVKLDYSLLDGILDCAIVADEKGTVEFFNKSAEQLLGYSKGEVLGKNVKMLMPSPYHEEHDQYLKNYMTTGQRKVIGTGRDVIAQRKDGTMVKVNLSLTEQGLEGSRKFTGVLRPTEAKKISTKSILQEEREVLDNLLVPAIVIDGTGTMHAFNQPASQMLGYTLLEVVGKNVKMLMPAPDKNKHDAYIQNYLKTGKARVLGKGRDVVALHRDGSMIPVHLSVTERRDEDKVLFTGILQKL